MGGNALKNCVTRRYDDKEYHSAAFKVVNLLNALFPKCKVDVIKSYKAKTDYGDLDILIESDNLPSQWVDQLVYYFKPKEYVKNGNVLSFEYFSLQVDLIATPSTQFDTSVNYFGFNDLGNLLGRLANSIGLKLGHDGLSYSWRTKDYVFRTEVICTDWKQICTLLDVDYEVYCQGFDNLIDIFQFVTKSRFFHQDIYLLENRNNYARTRDKKRKTYTEFLEYIQNHKHTDAQVSNKIRKDAEGKESYLEYHFSMIEGFKERHAEVMAEWEFEEEFKRRYNGDIVRELTGLDNRELGAFMKWVKDELQWERTKKDIVKFNPAVVPRWIKYWHAFWESEVKGK